MADKCIVCGREIEPCLTGKVRANAKYCSDECRKKGRSLYYKQYIKDKSVSDTEWATHRRTSNKEYQQIYRARKREDMLAEHAQKLATMSDEGEVESYVRENFRLKVS